jgi:hypothetical protein
MGIWSGTPITLLNIVFDVDSFFNVCLVKSIMALSIFDQTLFFKALFIQCLLLIFWSGLFMIRVAHPMISMLNSCSTHRMLILMPVRDGYLKNNRSTRTTPEWDANKSDNHSNTKRQRPPSRNASQAQYDKFAKHRVKPHLFYIKTFEKSLHRGIDDKGNHTKIQNFFIVLKHILVDNTHELLFSFLPKVACTNWRKIMLCTTYHFEQLDSPYNVSFLAARPHRKGPFV